ncbi:glucosamine 6-phosphate N-acetyltransferase [Stereum hirsutum FP-91666 SS1]|uniref:glucosamine 6-phosphate N-acetyltransferase n=1 Tax=Stereum hirsutum (strain FP-91666) TaxID=721885 RepID=UPI000444927A|nr:glucosamine 6-phosphate N-acetyltransferase [Stereum hirsutum FP-91666 SS1]EIM83740.1 glucosamine 6-phosphate N-acetyltransferase [Stereum hirsutum FP-91666 SS1]
MAKFTPDIELELLFPSHLIPQRVKDELPDDLHMRPLASTDYHRGHLDILAVLTHTPDPGAQAWLSQFQSISHAAYTYYSIVIVSKTTDRIVAVGTVFLERKFLRGLGLVGHIEDIAVDKSQQGKKLGLRVIQALTGISEGRGCYKTILNCNESNIPFYEKCGFERKEVEMTKYANERARTPRL